jgi:putative endonuclease
MLLFFLIPELTLFMAYLYILFSTALNKFYIGHTTLLPEHRLQKHLTNHDGFTAKAKDWTIVYQETFETKDGAHQREIDIKNKKSRKYIESLIAKGI